MYVGTSAREFPDRVAVTQIPSGRSLTYVELDQQSRGLADLLFERGVRPGDTIAILMENRPEFLVAVWAGQRSGLNYTPINWHLRPDEAAFIVDDCDAKAIVTSSTLAGIATEVADQCPNAQIKVSVDGGVDGFDPLDLDRLAKAEPITEREDIEGADMMYSSGTTGRPKGVRRTLGLQRCGTWAPPMAASLREYFEVSSEDSWLLPAPMYHSSPLTNALLAGRNGASVVMMEKFDAEQCLKAIEQHQITHFLCVPTMLIRMARLPAGVRESVDVSSLKVVLHGAAPCPEWAKREAIAWFGPVLYEFYGASEQNGLTMITTEDWLKHPGSVGRPILGQVHVLDDELAPVPDGTVGTIYFSGGQDFSYHKNAAATADTRARDGLSAVGDVGWKDAEGFLHLTDRKSNMIISGGVNIYPQEAENVLSAHPAVHDVAVVGVPNDDFGEEVRGVVQLAEGVVESPTLHDELLAYCRERLAHFKCPRAIDFVAELPRQPNGKLLKRLVRDRYWAAKEASKQ